MSWPLTVFPPVCHLLCKRPECRVLALTLYSIRNTDLVVISVVPRQAIAIFPGSTLQLLLPGPTPELPNQELGKWDLLLHFKRDGQETELETHAL